MKASVCIEGCVALSETQIQVVFHVSLSNGENFQSAENVGVSPSAATLNNAIKARVAAAAVSYGAPALANSDITIFGGVS